MNAKEKPATRSCGKTNFQQRDFEMIGIIIGEIAHNKHKKQADLADDIGCTQPVLNRYLEGKLRSKEVLEPLQREKGEENVCRLEDPITKFHLIANALSELDIDLRDLWEVVSSTREALDKNLSRGQVRAAVIAKLIKMGLLE